MDAVEAGLAVEEEELAIPNTFADSIMHPLEDYLSVPDQFTGYSDPWADQFDLDHFTYDLPWASTENIPQHNSQPYSFQQIEPHVPEPQFSLNTNGIDTLEADWMDLDTDLDFQVLGKTPEIPYIVESNINLLGTGNPEIPRSPMEESRRTILNSVQKDILTDWITKNPEPYPSREDKITLAALTGLSENASTPIVNQVQEQPTVQESIFPDALERKFGFAPDGFWPSNTSLPGRPEECSIRKTLKRSQSLPLFFTLGFIGSYKSTATQHSTGRLSLEAVVSARHSAASRRSNQGKRKPLVSIHGPYIPVQTCEDISKVNFVKTWIEDVARYAASPFEGQVVSLLTESCNTTMDSEDIKPGHIMSWTENLTNSPIPEELEHNYQRRGSISDLQRIRRIQNGCTPRANRDTYTAQLKDGERKPSTQKTHNATSFDAMSSAGSSAASATSASSYMSFGPRKGRRVAFQKPLELKEPQGPVDDSRCVNIMSQKRKASDLADDDGGQNVPRRAAVYACTFCRREFRTTYLWKRHEVSAHAPQVQWVCGSAMLTGWEANKSCPICMVRPPPDNSLSASPSCTHRLMECWEKPKSERTFFRKDALKQHVRLVHCKGDSTLLSCEYFNIDESEEKRDTTKYDLTCHFCGFSCGSWGERALHIITHFDTGVSMRLWIPQGPYALMRDGSAACGPLIFNMLKSAVYWRCICSASCHKPYITDDGWHEFSWTCSLCGFKINSDQESVLAHLDGAHYMRGSPCWISPPIFFRAYEFVEHLLTKHSAKRGNWMIRLIHAAAGGD
ncbi:hypothetical protein HD806DRAFT_538273 [Xylariaceae sp. AK1471]|nr:hypothetical protein HD806DRAFT_538273 [Xylariaceae sp. AK1471]